MENIQFLSSVIMWKVVRFHKLRSQILGSFESIFFLNYLSALKSSFRHFFTFLYTLLIILMQKTGILFLCIWPFEFLKYHYSYTPQFGTNVKFLDEWIYKYIRYYRYWTNEYPNIFGMIKISLIISKYICPWKNQQIFFRMNIFVQIIWMYLNIRLFSQDCFRLLWHFHILC